MLKFIDSLQTKNRGLAQDLIAGLENNKYGQYTCVLYCPEQTEDPLTKGSSDFYTIKVYLKDGEPE